MSSRCLEIAPRCVRLVGHALLAGIAFAAVAQATPAPTSTAVQAPLRVCADPDNLPFSHADGSGFENRIARLAADELKRPLVTFWWPQRRGLVRKTLDAGACDVLIGVPADFDRVLATTPYYRSSYVFVTRGDDAAPLRSFADPRLVQLRVGVQLVGNDLAATPPGHALAQRGATQHVVGFTIYGDGPAAERMLRALSERQLDAALVWGPQAGYFARHAHTPMRLSAATAPPELPLPFEFAIAMGVRRGDTALRDALNGVIERRRADIDAILAQYGVPRTDRDAATEPAR